MTTFRKSLCVLTSLSMPSGLLALRRPSARNTLNREIGAGLVETSISVGLVGTMVISSVVLFGGEINSQFSHRTVPVVTGGAVGQEDQSNVVPSSQEIPIIDGENSTANDPFNGNSNYWDVPSFIEPSYEQAYSPEPVYENDYSSVAGSISPPADEYISEDWLQRQRWGDDYFYADNSFVAGGISPASDPAHPDYIGPLRLESGDEASESDTWTWEQQYEAEQRLLQERLDEEARLRLMQERLDEEARLYNEALMHQAAADANASPSE